MLWSSAGFEWKPNQTTIFGGLTVVDRNNLKNKCILRNKVDNQEKYNVFESGTKIGKYQEFCFPKCVKTMKQGINSFT